MKISKSRFILEANLSSAVKHSHETYAFKLISRSTWEPQYITGLGWKGRPMDQKSKKHVQEWGVN